MSWKWEKEFVNPPSICRGAPFWAWNGKLEPDELRRQIRLMRRMGLGGFFMHSRVGLDTRYLADEWFACIDACIDEAKKLGMKAWLYDEDRWPSGAAGGLVTKNPKYRMRTLRLEILNNPRLLRWRKETVAVFVAEITGVDARNVRRLRKAEKPQLAAGEKMLHFHVKMHEPSRWYNGYTYLDTLSHEAVREFIRVTYEAYRRRCGKYFGNIVPGIFTDEPNHGYKLDRDADLAKPQVLPWTDKLPQIFRQRYGYDLADHLPELFFDLEGLEMSKARYHYHDCVTFLYVDAFNRQIGEWCGKNKLLFTGHQLAEDSLSSQTNMVGSCLRTYEYMQAPGMDLLTEHWRIFNTAKQVSSAARQFGAKWRLTETYGCTGWDFPFLGHKALGDWQVALGINLRCQHLAWYTMSGEAKRDYPAAIFYQSPWWELYPKVEDYFARLHVVLTQGEEVRDLLVIHPVESMWTQVKIGWHTSDKVMAMDRDFDRLTRLLLSRHLDFDFGDEEILRRHGKVRRGKIPLFQVGRGIYKAILVPSLRTMRRSTLALLQKFQAAGGAVIFVGEAPRYLEAELSSEAQEFARVCRRVKLEAEDLEKALAGMCRRVSIADTSGAEIGAALYLLREDKEAAYLFVCNTGEDFANDQGHQMAQPMARDRRLGFADVRIRLSGVYRGQPIELDAENGKYYAADAEVKPDSVCLRTSLPPLGSRLFVIPRLAGKPRTLPHRQTLRETRREKLQEGSWPIALSECSNLPLDRPRYRIGNGAWQAAEEILRIDRKVREALGMAPRSGDMVQPWAQTKPVKPRAVPVSLLYEFEVKAIPCGEVFLAHEYPAAEVRVNGVLLCADIESGWWVDRSLRRFPFAPALLRLGRNQIAIDLRYTEDHRGLEVVYLLGNFGTETHGTEVALVSLPSTLRIGDWTAQGLAFYSGSVAYLARIQPRPAAGERVFVCVPDYRGAAVRVLVNGQTAGIIGWEPNEVDITDFLSGEEILLGIEVIGHRRNSHGPFHINEKWPIWTGPGEFTRGPDSWRDDYQLVPCGLMAAPELSFRTAT